MDEKFSKRFDSLSLRTTVTGVSVLLLTLGLLVAGIGSATVLRNYLTSQVDAKISAAIQDLNPDSRAFFDSITKDCVLDSAPITRGDYFVAIYSADGELLCSNATDASNHPRMTEVSLAIRSNSLPETVRSATSKSDWRVTAAIAPFSDPSSGSTLISVVGYSLGDTDQLVAQFVSIFLFFGLTVIVLGGAATRILVSTAFSPLRDVEETAARFAAGDFNQRIAGAMPNTEVGRLNRSLNSMMNQIDKLFADRARTIDQMRRFVGDASHELRTPLVSVRGYAELYRMGALPNEDAVAQAMDRIEKEAIRMSELVADLLELARIDDETKPLRLANVDLVALARDAALDAMASSPARVVSVVEIDSQSLTDGPPVTASPSGPQAGTAATPVSSTGRIGLGSAVARLRRRARISPAGEPATSAPRVTDPSTARLVVTAEENKIRQVITNLMGNALRFTPPTSPIEIGLERDVTHERVVLSVIDHGEGIPPQIREKIFQRFWRADTSRNRDTGGSGLGLAIVASIVAAHKGSIDVAETPGGGATFRVTFPTSQVNVGRDSATIAE